MTYEPQELPAAIGVFADDTIAALATPPGKGAIAIVRVSGPGVGNVDATAVRTRRPLRARVAALAEFLDERGRLLDRGLALFFRAPESYTGEDLLEMHVHGSPIVAREICARADRVRRTPGGTRRVHAPRVSQRKDGTARGRSGRRGHRCRDAGRGRAAVANLGGGLAAEVGALRSAPARCWRNSPAAIDFPDEVADPEPRSPRIGICEHRRRAWSGCAPTASAVDSSARA